jgi:hypothetical protein
MENEVYAFALRNTLQEIQNACPEVTSNFIFKDGKILAKNKNTEEEAAIHTIEAFDAVAERADPVGDLESITIQSAEGKINIAAMEDFYLTTVSSKEADEKYVNTLTRILIPIVIKLSEKIQPAALDNETINEPEPEENDAYEPPVDNFLREDKSENNETEEIDQPEEEPTVPEPEPEEEPEIDDEPLLPYPPVTQLIVENLGGLLVPSDTVRVDQEVITRWNELYGDKNIKEVEIEALNGKTTRCKFKNIKKSKDTGKGIVKMPEKIQLTLETQQGELVTVKPVIE